MKNSKAELIKIINGLENTRELYYFYHNWRANQVNQIHRGSCGYCNYGFGMRQIQNRGAEGVWVGPFDTPELAEQYIADNGIDPHPRHNCCNP